MAALDAVDEADRPPIPNLQAETALAREIQDDIRKKLQAEYSDAGTEETLSSVLPEYIKVLVCNGKSRQDVVADLTLFLQEKAATFTDWLWQLLADRNPNRTHSAFPAATDRMDEDKAPGEKPRRKKKAAGPTGDDEPKKRQEDRALAKKRVRDSKPDRYNDPSGPPRKGLQDVLQTLSRQAARAEGEAKAGGAVDTPTAGVSKERLRRKAREEKQEERRRRAEGDDEAQDAVAGRRRLRVRGADPERTAKLRDEWDQMRQREEREQLQARRPKAAAAEDSADGVDRKGRRREREHDRDLLSPDSVAGMETKFTITMDKLRPEEVPSIQHYTEVDDVPEEPAAPAGPHFAQQPGPPLLGFTTPQQLGGLLGIVPAYGRGGGKGYGNWYGGGGGWKGGKGGWDSSYSTYGSSSWAPRGKGKGQTSSAAGPVQYGRGGGNLTLHKTQAPSGEGPALKKRLTAGGKGGKGKGTPFNHLVWEPGKSSDEDAAKAAAQLRGKTDPPQQRKSGMPPHTHKVWQNPAITPQPQAAAQKEGDAMQTDLPTEAPAQP
eukprot:TRINITY_DN50475_c0_g1_i1.p1 TRINITY_DN50475_c0_g1~~TRINITY_DN50475_c0_g1_i1.p1  ORF type:complete len:574 (+),score=183.43 TRINITY_DN50475_c0_g1_i1:79-1722(+)